MAKTKKNQSEAEITLPPKRTETHRIDTQAVRVVRSKLTPDWVERSVEDRDYGIDMMLEAFDGDQPTGILVLLQIKGHAAAFGDDIVMAIPVKTLLYARMFQAPFFLVNVSLEDEAVHFVWLQKYINARLTTENRRWNRQAHVNVHFPRDNVLDDIGLAKIRSLVKYTAHRDLGFTFLRHLIWLEQHIYEFRQSGDKPILEQALIRLREIAKLDEFLGSYEEHLEELDLDRLKNALSKALAYGMFDDDDHIVVDEEMLSLHQIELMFLSQDEIDGFVSEHSNEGLPY
jgi:hypothetical protein